MNITEKLTNELKKLNSNLGLTQEMLNLVSGAYVSGLTDSSTDEEIAAMAQKALPMMKGMQSESDRIRTAAVKAAEEKFKGGNGNGNQPNVQTDETPTWAKSLIEGLNKKNEEMANQIKALEAQNAKVNFDGMCSRVGKELGFSSEMLDLAKAGLSSDMDEESVRNKLGVIKKTLHDSGARFEERSAAQSASEANKANKEAGEAFFEQLKAQKAAMADA